MNEKILTTEGVDLNQYLKYIYGVTDKEIKDLNKFAKDLMEVMEKFLAVKNKDFLKKVIEIFNLCPAYGGFAIFEIIVNQNEILLENFCIEIITYYNANKKIEQGTDFIKDLSEVISSLHFFSPESTLRKLLIKNEENIFNFLIEECPKRSAIYGSISCRYADLYLASKKSNEKFILRIVEFFKILEKRVTEANEIIPEVKNALNVSLKEIKKLTFEFKEENKKTSLDQLKIILTRKTDLGNLFHTLIIGNESAIEAVFSSNNFSSEIINKCLIQMKLQQLLEVAIFLENSNAIDQYKIIKDFIEENYNIKPEDYVSKIRDLVTKYESSKFGILIREAMMMPMESEAKNPQEAINGMLTKLSTLANNLTAFISQVSLSISIALVSKTNLFGIFLSEYETKKHGNLAGGFASKMKDKDFMKKIKESDVAIMNIDQIFCKNIIGILICVQEVIKENFKSDQAEKVLNDSFSLLIKKYKIIISKKVFSRYFNIFLSKIPKNLI